MARFESDPNRLNYTVSQTGREYNIRLQQRAQVIFSQLLNLLPSNYVSNIQGPNYTIELKSVAVELARLELALEDVDRDRDFNQTRAEFLQSIIGYFVFLGGQIPKVTFDSEEFRRVLLNMIRIYFQGSIPQSMSDIVSLFISENFTVTENFLFVRKGGSGFDISDQFGFELNIELEGNKFPIDIFNKQDAIRTLLDIVRPAHTLYKLRFIFKDKYNPPGPGGRVDDSVVWHLSSYYYEDFRSFWCGFKRKQRLGKNVNRSVVGEDHSKDF